MVVYACLLELRSTIHEWVCSKRVQSIGAVLVCYAGTLIYE